MRFPGNYTFGCCNTPAEAEKKYESLIRHLKNGNAYALGNISGFASDKIDFMRLDDEHRLIPTNKIRFIYTKPYPFEDENEGKYMAVIEYTCTYEGTASTLFDTKEGAENQCREWVSACVEGRMFEQ